MNEEIKSLQEHALSFFERWQKRGVEKASEIAAALKAFGDREQAKLDWLREQIEMRVIGLSWNDVKTPWSSSSDEAVGTVAQLSEHLKEEILVREVAQRKAGELPSKEGTPEESCPAPLLQRKTFKTLGTPTVQADRLCQAVKAEPSSEEKLEAAKQRRTELEERGELDWVSDRQPYATGQGPVPDENLIGKKLEVRWRYYNKHTGEPIYIWCEGNVVQVADGEKDKKTARCRKLLPAGALRIQWPADAEFDEDESFVWTILKPCAFNKDIHLGWRFAASELKHMRKNTSQKARK
ncbi:hypothetical protein AB1Y20_007097 [Prymnesium parvum]|uniref:Uncharacterized protein n=1 Tax=Prymnesium parvum TaxID=97485 RepID=A0AB34IZY3_PRYPA